VFSRIHSHAIVKVAAVPGGLPPRATIHYGAEVLQHSPVGRFIQDGKRAGQVFGVVPWVVRLRRALAG
jgi:hypothetical protein